MTRGEAVLVALPGPGRGEAAAPGGPAFPPPFPRGSGPIPCGEGRLDPARRRLLDGRGRELPLRNKSFELLRVLLERAGQVVTRDELLDLVWPGIHVGDDCITQGVVEIRRQLRQIPGPRLRTVHRHGYVLEGAARTGPAPVLAVARFDALGEGAGVVAEAIVRELRVDLARAGGFRVVGGGGELSPDLVLRGLVQLAEARLRITAELVEARSGALRWAERADAELAGVGPLGAQSALAGLIAGRLRDAVSG